MKKHISVLMLLCRMTLRKLTIVLLVMAAVQCVLFYLAMSTEAVTAEAGIGLTGSVSLENTVHRSHIVWISAAGFAAFCVILSLSGCEFGSKCGYTLRRLSLSEERIFLWQAAYCAACFLLLWAAEAIMLYSLTAWFMHFIDPAYTSSQTVFLAFYRSEFLHALLPLEDIWLWIRNALMSAGLGIACAAFPYRQRIGKFGGEIIVLLPLTLLWFTHELGEYGTDILLMLSYIAVCAEAIWYVYAPKEAYV